MEEKRVVRLILLSGRPGNIIPGMCGTIIIALSVCVMDMS